MAAATTFEGLVAGGHEVDAGEQKLGFLRDSSDTAADVGELHRRMAADGCLFLRGLLDRDQVLAARREIVRRLAEAGHLASGTDPMDAVIRQGVKMSLRTDLAADNAPLHRVLYEGPMIAFFERFLGGQVRHFDYTWLRAVAPGRGTPSHCDIVYMGRGTTRLYTAWTPLGDIDLVQGGLMILNGSHRNDRLRETYGKYDVDTYCTNRPQINGWKRSGHLTTNPNQIRRSVGGRWETAEYRAGDVLIFSMYTIHASLDNRSNRVRLSSDSRYQLASEPADERWIGPNPIAHSKAGKRGRIC